MVKIIVDYESQEADKSFIEHWAVFKCGLTSYDFNIRR